MESVKAQAATKTGELTELLHALGVAKHPMKPEEMLRTLGGAVKTAGEQVAARESELADVVAKVGEQARKVSRYEERLTGLRAAECLPAPSLSEAEDAE